MKFALLLAICSFFLNSPLRSQPHPDHLVYALVKLSWNQTDDSSAQGGISGTAFAINDSTLLTAHHVLNPGNYKPHAGRKHVQYWFLRRDGGQVLPVAVDQIDTFPEIEAALIHYPARTFEGPFWEPGMVMEGDSVQSWGFYAHPWPIHASQWVKGRLQVMAYDLRPHVADFHGMAERLQRYTVHAEDVWLDNARVIKPSFGAYQGMSGGPLLVDNRLTGIMSFGLPINKYQKDSVYAISVFEFFTLLN
mgnify:CR=1 FL=1